MSRENRKITNGNGKSIILRIDPSDTIQGKSIILRIDPSDTIQHIYSEVHWTITQYQWKRLLLESDSTAWETEKGATILFSCHPFAADCRYPGRS